MTVPNLFSASRIVLTPIIIFLLLADQPGGTFAAAVLLIVSGVTDIFDGYLARRFKQVSTFGVFLDLAADKVLVSGAIVTLVQLQLFPVWVAVIIIGREFAVTALRLAAASAHMIIPAQGWGKSKTVVTLVALIFVVLKADLLAGGPITMLDAFGVASFLLIWLTWPLVLLATALTIVSGLSYFLGAFILSSERRRQIGPSGSNVYIQGHPLIGRSQIKRVTFHGASSVYRLFRRMRGVP